MKKILSSLLTLTTFYCSGQILQIGVKGGVNYANFKGSSLDSKAITSYLVGPTVNLKVSKGLFLQGELLYSTVGAKYKQPVKV